MPKILEDISLNLTVAIKPDSTATAQSDLTAEAKLTSGTYLLPGYTVTLQIGGGGKATFKSGGQTASGLVTNPLGRVSEPFTFPYDDSGTIQATVTNNPAGGSVSGIQSPAQPYQFTGRALPKAIYLYPLKTCALPNGASQDSVLAVVMGDNNAVYTDYIGSLDVAVTGSANRWSPTLTVTKGFAQHTSNDGTQEDVTLTVTLSDYSGVSQTQTMIFKDTWWDVQVIWSKGYGSVYNGNGSITASYQFNAIKNPGPVDLWICLDPISNSSFDSNVTGYQNSKVLKVAGATIDTGYKDVTVTGSGTATLYISATAPGDINTGLFKSENIGTATLNLG